VYQRFRGTLTRHLRLPIAIPDALLDEAVRERLGLKDDSFLETLQRADAASHAQKISTAEALELIQKLEKYEMQLGLKKKKQEKP
jgi:bifunctional DNA-binding transcriptional regulator/antitoxin component of YhaV-PrlF toxin-antitoxin module